LIKSSKFLLHTIPVQVVAISLFVAVSAPSGFAQGTARGAPRKTDSVIALGTRVALQSNILGEAREILVSTPVSYAKGGRFPVLYVLDAENFLTTVSAARALAFAGRMPPSIVVAVVNTKRDRDFTPTLTRTTELPPGADTAGGADSFLSFLAKEVIPAVDARYRTQPMRTIIGHSLGGLLAMHALAVRPELFRAYLTLEPSLWWDAREPVQRVFDAFRARPALVGRLVAVEGTSDDGWKPDLEKLRTTAPAHFQTAFVHIENESHENLPYRGIYEGLAMLFRDYMPAMRHNLGVATLPALTQQYAELSRDFGYSVTPPLSAVLRIANGEANQRRFDQARAALALADSLYPGSSDIAQFRAGVDAAAAEAARTGLKAIRSTVHAAPIASAQAAPLLGAWSGVFHVEPGTPMNAEAFFFLRGDTLFVRMTARGVAIDGGDLVEAPAPVEVNGDALKWDRENAGGGRAVVVARRTANTIEGEETIVGGREMPAEFMPPKVTVTFTRR
jgi:putative esterase